MRIIAKRALVEFWARHPDAREPLEAWYHVVRKRVFASPHEIKALFGTASILGDGRVVFNIGGNKYRVVAHMRYDLAIVFVSHVLTHSEYDALSARRTLNRPRG